METNIQSTAFQEFKQAAETIINPEMQKWNDQGKKIVGYFCSSFPEELIAAAGLLPFRMRATGSTGTELSDAHFASNNCSLLTNSDCRKRERGVGCWRYGVRRWPSWMIWIGHSIR